MTPPPFTPAERTILKAAMGWRSDGDAHTIDRLLDQLDAAEAENQRQYEALQQLSKLDCRYSNGRLLELSGCHCGAAQEPYVCTRCEAERDYDALLEKLHTSKVALNAAVADRAHFIEINKLLRERPDLGDRAPRVEAIIKARDEAMAEVLRLTAANERMQKDLQRLLHLAANPVVVACECTRLNERQMGD